MGSTADALTPTRAEVSYPEMRALSTLEVKGLKEADAWALP
jgi:hypothetical protein